MQSLASALGFKRGDMPQSQAVSGALPLYPPLATVALPDLKEGSVVEEGAIHAQLCTAYAESPYYRAAPPPAAAPVPIKRYTDKYRLPSREPFRPKPGLVPDELLVGKWARFRKDRSSAPAAKRPKKTVEATLAALDQAESAAPAAEEDAPPPSGAEESDSEAEERKRVVVEEKEEVSDEDYAEEDNDYATSYFDNGEAYAADDSGDNIDDENVY